MECKLRYVMFRRVSDRRRALLPANRVTGQSLGAPMTGLGVPGSARDRPGSAATISGSTSNHSRAVPEK